MIQLGANGSRSLLALRVTVATIAAATLLQHLVKVAVFSFAGFDVSQCVAVYGHDRRWRCRYQPGARAARQNLRPRLQRHLNLLLTLLALRLIWQAMSAPTPLLMLSAA